MGDWATILDGIYLTNVLYPLPPPRDSALQDDGADRHGALVLDNYKVWGGGRVDRVVPGGSYCPREGTLEKVFTGVSPPVLNPLSNSNITRRPDEVGLGGGVGVGLVGV